MRASRIVCLLLAWLSQAANASHEITKKARENEPHNPLDLFRVADLVIAPDGAVRVHVNSTALERSGQWFEVYWSGVNKPRLDDYVALYTPATADPTKTAPVKFKLASSSPTHRSIGAGHLRFRVLNMRQSFKFVFLRNGLQFPEVVAQSEPVENLWPNQPMQGHLSLTGKPGEVMVQWVTRDTGSPTVRWGTEPGVYTHASPAHSITYTREELCGPPATGAGWVEPGMLHAAVMTGLGPGKTYYYVFGDDSEGFGWSKEAAFRGPPRAGRDQTVKVLAVADLGQAERDGSNEVSMMLASLNTTDRMAAEAEEYDLLVHNGDISYARGYSTQWDVFFDQMGPIVSKLPYMTQIGNHERDWPETGDRFPTQYDSGGECGIPYYRRTRMPTPAEDQHWYSFDLGPIHFLQYSTEHWFEPGSPQHAFIEKDLRSVDRSVTPWVVVGGHRPMYVDSTFGWPPDGDQYVAAQLRDSLEGLFYKWGVDVTWHGHHHSYQRTCPVMGGHCVGMDAEGVAGAPVHLVIGHAGAGLTPNIHLKRPEIFESVQLQHGYVRVSANATHLHHQVVSSSTGETLDEFNLFKPPSWVFTPRALAPAITESRSHRQGAHALASAK